jgi:putative oxygen-independent coproporphyrinogen III oxidase
MIKTISSGNVDSASAWSKIIPTAAYIHIPFCRRRCYYCDFPISVVGDKGRSASTMIEDYLAALIQDIQLTSAARQPLKTVFFGGGTPSLLSPAQLEQIILAIALRFGIANDAEISMEIDPGTFDRDRLLGYLAAGVNRFSLGVQTFDEELLKLCGRSHTFLDVMQAVETIQQLNIKNFSLDLISGLPQQTLKHCQTSLEQAIAIAPQHLSCYDLVLEPVTAFGKQYQPGETPLPNDDDTAEMYRLTQQTLTGAGYEHYEISNYAQSNYQCRHNQVYWENKPYYGFGMGAASYVAGQRFSRPRTRREYYAWLEAGAVIDAPEISSTDYLLETLMLGLRLASGVNLDQFSPQVQQAILSVVKPYLQRGWVKIIGKDHQSAKLRLSDPEGFLFSNTILATLFQEFA